MLGTSAGDGVDVEILGLDSHRLLELELVCWVIEDQVKALEDSDQSDLCFLPCERPTDACTDAVPERLPGIGWELVELLTK